MTPEYGKAMTAEEARQAMVKDPEVIRETTPVQLPVELPLPADIKQVPIRVELREAATLYGEAVNYAHEFMKDVREGKPFDFNDAAPLVNGFIDSVFRNDSAAAAISKLRSFDEYTYTHCINVSILAVILGRKLGYSRSQLELVGIAGMFHDLGKAAIPGCILNKPGKLSEQEMNIMRTHPLHGYRILKEQKGIPEAVLRGALEHHEKHDGSGYPRGLEGDEISDTARLLAVVDVYDALTSKRVYKAPLPPGQVLGMMYQWRVTDYHPNIVEQFIKSMGVYPVGSFVRLTSGEYGVVLDHCPGNPLNPSVRVAFDSRMRAITMRTVELSRSEKLQVADVINPDEYGIDVFTLIH